jgi:hypothetical protein
VGSSWASRFWAGIFAIVAAACVISTASAAADITARPIARDANDQRPFAIVDKRQATLSVYDGAGRLVGRTPALLGVTPGDIEPASARGKSPSALQMHERVTPAGRFQALPGRNLSGERVVWFDYEANLAIHRLRPTASREYRLQRLASNNPNDHRVTLGCVVVDPAFFDEVVLPTLGQGSSLVYVLPEREPTVAAGAGTPRVAVP